MLETAFILIVKLSVPVQYVDVVDAVTAFALNYKLERSKAFLAQDLLVELVQIELSVADKQFC